MPHPSGWNNDRLVASIAVNNIKNQLTRHVKKSKTPETVWGSANLDLRVRWVSAVMKIPFRNYLLMGKGRKADDCANRSENARCGGRK